MSYKIYLFPLFSFMSFFIFSSDTKDTSLSVLGDLRNNPTQRIVFYCDLQTIGRMRQVCKENSRYPLSRLPINFTILASGKYYEKAHIMQSLMLQDYSLKNTDDLDAILNFAQNIGMNQMYGLAEVRICYSKDINDALIFFDKNYKIRAQQPHFCFWDDEVNLHNYTLFPDKLAFLLENNRIIALGNPPNPDSGRRGIMDNILWGHENYLSLLAPMLKIVKWNKEDFSMSIKYDFERSFETQYSLSGIDYEPGRKNFKNKLCYLVEEYPQFIDENDSKILEILSRCNITIHKNTPDNISQSNKQKLSDIRKLLILSISSLLCLSLVVWLSHEIAPNLLL